MSSNSSASEAASDGDGDEQSAHPARKQEFSYGADPTQKYDLYLPASADGLPILVMVHGGAWKLGDKENASVVERKVQYFGRKHYAVVSVNYRLTDANPIDQAEDVARALAHVQRTASRWGGDTRRLLLMGHSAGAHLVSLLSSDLELVGAAGLAPWLGTVALDSAAYDVTAIMRRRHFRFYDQAFGTDPEFWKRASPIHRLSGPPPPFLAVCSTERSDSCWQAEAYVDRARQLGGRAELLRVALSHREINAELGNEGQYTKDVEAFLMSLGLP